MKYKAVFFDFDGTLMNTSEGVYKGAEYAMAKAGLEISPSAYWDGFIGPPLHDCFRITFGIEDRKTLDTLCMFYREYYRKQGMKEAVFYDGILDVIKNLRLLGCKTAIASMKNTDLIKMMCSYFKVSDLFDGFFGLNIEEDNTKADVLRQGMAVFNLIPSQCVLVGDTYVDVQGAEQAGCACIKAGWGFGFNKTEQGAVISPADLSGLLF